MGRQGRLIVALVGFCSVFVLCSPAVWAADDKPLLGGSIGEILGKGGIVLVVILAGSVVGLALAFERMVALRRRTLVPSGLASSVRDAAKGGRVQEIEDLVREQKGPLARILKAGLQRKGRDTGEIERAMEAVGGHEVSRLKRPVRPIAVLATVEPLLGLLGTIIGMIITFNQLHTTTAAERVEKLAPGIGQALYTTAAGLCVAIPFVVIYHWLVGKVNRAAEEWSVIGSEVVLALGTPPATQPATVAAAQKPEPEPVAVAATPSEAEAEVQA